jgi:predicted dehydrogenase
VPGFVTRNTSEMDTRNLAVIGLGKMGVMHCAMVSVVPGAQLAAVVDQKKGTAGYLRGLGIEARFFDSVDQLLSESSLNLHGAIIATPQNVHRAVGEQCLRAGIGVLVEKPLAHTLEDAQAMVHLAEQFPALPAGVAYMKAHYPIYRRLKEILSGGTLGRLEAVEARSLFGQVLRPHGGWIYDPSRSGGGVLINSACHMLQLLHFLFGRAQSVDASTRRIHSREVEDEAELQIRFESGIDAQVKTSWSTPGYDTEYTEINLAGENGRIVATDDFLQLDIDSPTPGFQARQTLIHRCDLEQARFNLSPDYGGEGYYFENLDFVESLRATGRQPAVTWKDGWEVQRTLDAAYRSAGGAGVVTIT